MRLVNQDTGNRYAFQVIQSLTKENSYNSTLFLETIRIEHPPEVRNVKAYSAIVNMENSTKFPTDSAFFDHAIIQLKKV
jgi:hypothetical protein